MPGMEGRVTRVPLSWPDCDSTSLGLRWVEKCLRVWAGRWNGENEGGECKNDGGDDGEFEYENDDDDDGCRRGFGEYEFKKDSWNEAFEFSVWKDEGKLDESGGDDEDDIDLNDKDIQITPQKVKTPSLPTQLTILHILLSTLKYLDSISKSFISKIGKKLKSYQLSSYYLIVQFIPRCY